MGKFSRFISLLPIYILAVCSFLVIGFGGNSVITVLSENAPIKGRRTIIIDAGHGGEDGGTTSCTGINESHINLQIALRLEDLAHLLGINTVMIRSTDSSVHTAGNSIAARKVSDLKNRVSTINATENAIVVSIHQNYFSDSRYYGAQVFYAPTEGSKQFAIQLQESLVHALNPGSKRQVKKADGIYLMQNINCTGILIECGFLSNPTEDALLQDDNYQKNLCCVIASCCSRYIADFNVVT